MTKKFITQMVASIKTIVKAGLLSNLVIGLVIMLVAIFWGLTTQLASLLQKLIRLIGIDFFGSLYVILVILIFTFGIILNSWQGKSVLLMRLSIRVPLIGKILLLLGSINNIVKKGKFILVKDVPGKGAYAVAITAENSIKEVNEAVGEEVVSVGFCSYPVPGTGPLISFVRPDMIRRPNLSPHSWIQIIMSGGLLASTEIESVLTTEEKK